MAVIVKSFIKFLLCTLFLCVQSSQAYVTSAVLWRFNKNAGANAGTEVLVLGDVHVNKSIGKGHGKVLLNKINEWAQYTEKTHFMLEGGFPKDPSDLREKIMIFDKNTKQAIFQDLPLPLKKPHAGGNQTVHILRGYVDYDYNSKSNIQFNYADIRNFMYPFYEYLHLVGMGRYFLQGMFFHQPLGYDTFCIHPDLNLKKLVENLYTITLEKIQSLKKDCKLPKNSVEDTYIHELLRSIKNSFARTMGILTTGSGKGLCVRDLQEKFKDLYNEFTRIFSLSGDMGFLLGFIKHKSQYKRHIIFVGARHAAIINILMERYKQKKEVEEIKRVGIDDIFTNWPYEFKTDFASIPPIKTPVLTNMLNLAFTQRICVNCFKKANQSRVVPVCCKVPRNCSLVCKKQDWKRHELFCSYFWRGLLTCKSFLFGAGALTAGSAVLYKWNFGK